MQKRFWISLIVVALVVAFLIFTLRPSPTTNAINEQLISGNSNASASNSGTKFADSPYYQYAYLISGDTLSSQAKTALTGFDLSKTSNSDGSMTYTLTALRQEYANQTYTLQPGEKLYFIERSLGDDDTAGNSDYSLRDDTAIIVNSDGYIVQ